MGFAFFPGAPKHLYTFCTRCGQWIHKRGITEHSLDHARRERARRNAEERKRRNGK